VYKNANGIKRLSWQSRKRVCTVEKEGVDEQSETLHNLIPLLLTNKTIRKRSKAVPNTSSLKINSR
jgi:hypothetical protein